MRKFILIVGSPGAGKSTFAKKLAKSAKGNVIVYKHSTTEFDKAFMWLPTKNIHNWRQGVKPDAPAKCKMLGVTKKDYKEFIGWVAENYRNGLLIIDDASIFERDRSGEDLIKLLSMRRHINIDIVYIFHGLTYLPIDQFIFVNYFIIFNTVDRIDYKKNRIPNYEKIQRAIHTARNNFRIGGKNKYTPAIIKNY